MPNIEIKARYPDAAKAKAVATRLNARYVGRDHQVDTYFRTHEGRLKLRESSLSGNQLVPYLRPDQSGPKRSEYLVISVSDAALCKSLLGKILGTEVVVDKTREIYLIDNVRVHIDSVVGLGNFFEFEAVYTDPSDEKSEFAKVSALIKEFEIAQEDLLTGSYRELKMKSG
jgi:predicted adenylyl cyclase CyaB